MWHGGVWHGRGLREKGLYGVVVFLQRCCVPALLLLLLYRCVTHLKQTGPPSQLNSDWQLNGNPDSNGLGARSEGSPAVVYER